MQKAQNALSIDDFGVLLLCINNYYITDTIADLGAAMKKRNTALISTYIIDQETDTSKYITQHTVCQQGQSDRTHYKSHALGRAMGVQPLMSQIVKSSLGLTGKTTHCC